MFRSLPARDVAVLLASLAAIAVVTASLRTLPEISPTTVALALLLVVLGTATISRLRIAIVVSVVAMLTLNFFFLPPVGTFTIVDPQNWIALFAFLVVAVIASNLSAAAQDRARVFRRLLVRRSGLLVIVAAIIAAVTHELSLFARWVPIGLFLAPPVWAWITELRLMRRLAKRLDGIDGAVTHQLARPAQLHRA